MIVIVSVLVLIYINPHQYTVQTTQSSEVLAILNRIVAHNLGVGKKGHVLLVDPIISHPKIRPNYIQL